MKFRPPTEQIKILTIYSIFPIYCSGDDRYNSQIRPLSAMKTIPICRKFNSHVFWLQNRFWELKNDQDMTLYFQ